MFELINNNNYFCPNCILFLTATTYHDFSIASHQNSYIIYEPNRIVSNTDIDIYNAKDTSWPDRTTPKYGIAWSRRNILPIKMCVFACLWICVFKENSRMTDYNVWYVTYIIYTQINIPVWHVDHHLPSRAFHLGISNSEVSQHAVSVRSVYMLFGCHLMAPIQSI